MLNRDPERERPPARRPRRVGDAGDGDRLGRVRRALRWLNLTLIQQGIWPLLIVVAGAPAVPVAATPWDWWVLRAGAPALAALLAAIYLLQQPSGGPRWTAADDERGDRLRQQARILLVGVAVAVALLRLIVGPAEAVAKLIAFGATDVAAFHLIHFGVVARAIAAPEAARLTAIALFGVSWGVRELLVAAVDRDPALLPVVFAGGLAVGSAVATVSWLLRRWPGGWLPAMAAHWLVVYLIGAFIR